MNNVDNALVDHPLGAPQPPADLQTVLCSPAMRQAIALVGRVLCHQVSAGQLDSWQHPTVAQLLNSMAVFAAKKAAATPAPAKPSDNHHDMTPQDQQPPAFVVKRTRRQLSTSDETAAIAEQPPAKHPKASPQPVRQSAVHNSCFPDIAVHCDSLGLVSGVSAALESISTRTAHQLVALIEPRIQARSPVYGLDVDGQALGRYATVVLSQSAAKLADDILIYCQHRQLQSQEPRVAQQLAEAVRKQVARLVRNVLRNVQTALQACPDVDQPRALAALRGMAEFARPLFAKATRAAQPVSSGRRLESEPQYSDVERLDDVDEDVAWLQPSLRTVSSSTSSASSMIDAPLENYAQLA
jgi:hypothetical protein